MLPTIQFLLHYSLHFLAPAALAWVFFHAEWKRAWLLMLATMAIDLDHLWADPIFDPCRCSVGFHTFHSYPAIVFYIGLFCFPKTRIVGLGLLFHILTDCQDCLWSNYLCQS